MISSECDAVSDAGALAQHIDCIERGYEFLLAYAAQGRQDDAGTPLRDTLSRMHEALTAMQSAIGGMFADDSAGSGVGDFASAVESDIRIARGAIGLVLSRQKIASLLIDNLNASVHLRALLTDLFLIEQAGKSPAQSM
jgi:hypothetical protein